LIVILALVVVGPRRLPIALRAIGRGIAEFRRATRELRAQVGYDEVVDEVTRPLREGMASLGQDALRLDDDEGHGIGTEYPEGGPDDYGAIPESSTVYPDVAPVYAPEAAAALQGVVPRETAPASSAADLSFAPAPAEK
jgi:Sec-independent protein translocase protein TatA